MQEIKCQHDKAVAELGASYTLMGQKAEYFLPFLKDGGVLHYTFLNYTEDLSINDQRYLYEMWSNSMNHLIWPLRLKFTPDIDKAQIKICWIADGVCKKDGEILFKSPHEFGPQTLAVAYNNYGGKWSNYILMNDNRMFTLMESKDFSLYNAYKILKHEGGHVFNIGHSKDRTDLMYPTYDPKLDFGEDTKNALNSMYMHMRLDVMETDPYKMMLLRNLLMREGILEQGETIADLKAKINKPCPEDDRTIVVTGPTVERTPAKPPRGLLRCLSRNKISPEGLKVQLTKLDDEQKASLRAIRRSWEKHGGAAKDNARLAYIIATAYYESDLRPIKERRARQGTALRRQQDRYWHTGYYGRGFVQLTWRDNYERMDNVLGLHGQLVANPDLALDTDIAADILVLGMMQGYFTGVGVPKYVYYEHHIDFINARRVVNGTDRAEEIANLAQSIYESNLLSDGLYA